MSDPVVSQMIAIPGMKIAYHFQIAEGQMIAYEVAEDRTASAQDLRELLGRLDDAAVYLKAKTDLPKARTQLRLASEKLPKAEKALHEAIAKQEAHIALMSRDRRNPQAALGVDVNAVAQAQNAVQVIRDAIRFAEDEIPRLEAIIDGRERPKEAEPEPSHLSIVAAE